jgi:hypothetical protein
MSCMGLKPPEGNRGCRRQRVMPALERKGGHHWLPPALYVARRLYAGRLEGL